MTMQIFDTFIGFVIPFYELLSSHVYHYAGKI